MRRILDLAFQALALLILLLALGSLAALIADVWSDGAGRLSWSFLTGFPSRRAADAGIFHALSGSVFVIFVTGALAVPIGVASAIYLEEYGRRNFVARIIEINITNLAAVPSIIYGLLGLGLFVRAMGMGRSVLAGASTLALLVLPVVILATREATRQLKKTPLNEYSTFWWLGLAASAMLLIAPSWTGHAAASASDFRLAVFTDWLHLIAGGFWVGGLFHLALTLRVALASVPDPERATVVYHFITRFTRVAIPSVVLLALAGLYNTWAHIPGFKAFWITPYGKTLTLKLVLVGVMLVLGGFNNFYFGKRAKRLVEARKTNLNASSASRFERSFRRSVALEAALGLLVLLVTAILVFLTPARNHPSMTSSKAERDVILGRR